MKNKVSFKFPFRVYMCPLNFSDFDFSGDFTITGGGYGFAFKQDNTFNCFFSEKDEIICNNEKRILLIEYLLNLMRNECNVNQKVKVEINLDKSFIEHSGIGSNSSLIVACLYGFNKLFGDKLNKEQLFEIFSNNYYENSNGKLVKGLSTGLCFHTFFEGGFVVVGNNGRLVFHKKLPDNMVCFIINPKVNRDLSQNVEDVEQLKNSQEMDRNYKYYRAYRLLMDILPDIITDKYDNFATFNYENHVNGWQKALIESFPNKGKDIFAIMSLFNDNKYIIGLTSTGPHLYLLTQFKDDAKEVLNKNQLEYIEVEIENLNALERFENSN